MACSTVSSAGRSLPGRWPASACAKWRCKTAPTFRRRRWTRCALRSSISSLDNESTRKLVDRSCQRGQRQPGGQHPIRRMKRASTTVGARSSTPRPQEQAGSSQAARRRWRAGGSVFPRARVAAPDDAPRITGGCWRAPGAAGLAWQMGACRYPSPPRRHSGAATPPGSCSRHRRRRRWGSSESPGAG